MGTLMLRNQFRSPHLWDKVSGEWKLRYRVENLRGIHD